MTRTASATHRARFRVIRKAPPSQRMTGLLHGGGGNRTHVRKSSALRPYVRSPCLSYVLRRPRDRAVQERSWMISSPRAQALAETSLHSDGLIHPHRPRDGRPRTTTAYAARASSTLSLAFVAFAGIFTSYQPARHASENFYTPVE